MKALKLEEIPQTIQQMAQQIDRIESILSEKQSPPDTGKKQYI